MQRTGFASTLCSWGTLPLCGEGKADHEGPALITALVCWGATRRKNALLDMLKAFGWYSRGGYCSAHPH